jgi:hypothetical protein
MRRHKVGFAQEHKKRGEEAMQFACCYSFRMRRKAILKMIYLVTVSPPTLGKKIFRAATTIRDDLFQSCHPFIVFFLSLFFFFFGVLIVCHFVELRLI